MASILQPHNLVSPGFCQTNCRAQAQLGGVRKLGTLGAQKVGVLSPPLGRTAGQAYGKEIRYQNVVIPLIVIPSVLPTQERTSPSGKGVCLLFL